MDSLGTLYCPTQKWNFYPKIFYTYPKRINFLNESIFQAHLKDPNPWHTHLAHPKKKFLLRKFLRLIKRISFSNETIFHTRVEKLMFKPKKIKYQKKLIFQSKKNFLWLPEKIISPTKNLLYLREKNKALHFICVLNRVLLFFMVQTNKTANQK